MAFTYCVFKLSFEGERMSGGGAKIKGDKGSKAISMPTSVSPILGLQLTSHDIMT